MAAAALTTLALAAGAVPAPAEVSGAATQLEALWVERGPGRTFLIRAVTTAGECPGSSVNGKPRQMDLHAAGLPPSFPVLTCEREANLGAERLRVAGLKLRAPPADPRRIVVVGDTGCRLAAPNHFQACNDPQQWPFAQVAEGIADLRPDLIVHVGDYLYREAPCPAGNAGCAGSPHGDNWPTWDADFFTPAQPALKAAPWVVMRGNHESCNREGGGWFRFLDPRPMPPACLDVTAPYATSAGRIQMLNLDSSAAGDFPPFNPEPYAPQFAALAEMIGKRKAWFLTHRPLWGLAAISGGTRFAVTNETLQRASGNSLPPKVQLVVSGHLHNFEVFDFSGTRPPQIVSGGGGTQLDDPISAPVLGADVAGQAITEDEVVTQFGFMLFVRKPRRPGWTATIRDAGGGLLSRCRIARGAAGCSR